MMSAVANLLFATLSFKLTSCFMDLKISKIISLGEVDKSYKATEMDYEKRKR